MARIVPAKPKMKSDYAGALVTRLQAEIGDETIIFQNVPAPGALVCMAPGKLPVVVRCVQTVEAVDLDAQEVVSGNDALEIPDLMAEAMEIAQRHGLGPVGMIVLSATECARSSLPRVEGIAEAAVTSDPDEVFGAMRVQTSKISVAEIEAVLQVQAPGASAYEPGTVTRAQLAWRETLVGEGTSTEPPAPVTAPAQVSTEKFRLNDGSPKRVQHLEKMVTSLVDNLAKDRDIFAAGLAVDASFVGASDAFLPVLLVAASEKWSPVVAKVGRGGFDVRLKRDTEALVGFRVADVLASSPYLLFMPIARVVRAGETGEGIELDNLFAVFSRWLQKYDLGDARIEDVTVSIALQDLGGENQD